MELCDFCTYHKSRSDAVYLIPLGDIHKGTKSCETRKLRATIDWIKHHPKAYWLGMGDYCDFLNYTDKRFDSKELAPEFWGSLDNLHYAQMDSVADMLMPIKSRCIGLLTGNHEESIRRKYHSDITMGLALKLQTKCLGFTTLIRWKFVMSRGYSATVTIYATHGWMSGRLTGGPLNQLTQVSKSFDADIYLAGHSHKKIHEEQEILRVVGNHGNPHLIAAKKVFGITGTFYKSYDVGSKSYAEQKGFPPTPTGVIKIRIEPFRCEWRKDERGIGKSVNLPPHIHVSA